MMEPFDVMDIGRMAVAQDPQGAAFAIWEAKTHHGVGVFGEANTLCWNELMTADADGARTFYPAAFGWTAKVSPEYTEWHVGDRPIGGLVEKKGVSASQMPPHWIPYFMVDDADAIADGVRRLGGTVHKGPEDIEHVGRFAVASDPQGAMFAIIQMNPMHG